MTEITRHFTASIFIVHNNKVLLHQHKKLNLLLPPGGHIDRDELPHEAAIREAKEETGLDVKLFNSNNLKENYFKESTELNRGEHLNLHNINKFHQHIDFVFFGKTQSNNLSPEKGESKEIYWFSREDIENNSNIKHETKKYALEALDTLSS